MGSDDGDLYVMQEGEDGEWVNPTSVRTLIREALADETDLDVDDVDDLGEYVDWEHVQAVLDGGEDDVTFDVEDVGVTVDADGEITVDE